MRIQVDPVHAYDEQTQAHRLARFERNCMEVWVQGQGRAEAVRGHRARKKIEM